MKKFKKSTIRSILIWGLLSIMVFSLINTFKVSGEILYQRPEWITNIGIASSIALIILMVFFTIIDYKKYEKEK